MDSPLAQLMQLEMRLREAAEAEAEVTPLWLAQRAADVWAVRTALEQDD